MKLIGIIFFTFIFCGSLSRADEATFQKIGYYDPSASLVKLDNGDALFIGTSVFRFDHQSATWFKVNSPNIPRTGHDAIQLDNGHVLIVGGFDSNSKQLLTPEIYDVKSDRWVTSTDAPQTFKRGAMVQLSNSEVLVVGRDPSGWNWDCNKAFIFNVIKNSWVAVDAPYTYCPNTKLYKMTSGKVMALSEVNGLDTLLFDPITRSWAGKYSQIKQPGGNRGVSGQTADHSVFIAVNADSPSNTGKIIKYDESSNQWHYIADWPGAFERDPNYGNFGFTTMEEKFVLFGYRQNFGFDGQVYDPKLKVWSSFKDPGVGINYGPSLLQASLITNNRLLAVPPHSGGISVLFPIH